MRCSQCAYIFDDDVSEVGVQYVDAQSDLRALWIFIKGCSACTGGKRTDLSLVWAGLPPGSTWLNEVFNLSSVSLVQILRCESDTMVTSTSALSTKHIPRFL